MKKKNIWILIFIIVLIIILCIVGALAYWFTKYYPRYQTGKNISNLLQTVLTEENQSMNVEVKADIAGEHLEAEADVCIVSQGKTKYIVIKMDDYVFYVADGVLYLESGKAYKLMEEMKDITAEEVGFFAQIAAIYELVEVKETQEGLDHIYSVTTTEKKAEELLASVAPEETKKLENIEEIALKLVEHEDELESIQMTGDVVFDKKDISFTVAMSNFKVLGEDAYVIPAEVKNAAAMVDKDSLFSLTKDLYRLMIAAHNLSAKEKLEGTVELSANCGAINFNKKCNLEDLEAGISNLANKEEIEKMPQTIAALCLEGDVSCKKVNNAYVYELELEEEEILNLSQTIVPDIVNEVVSLSNGKAIITVENRKVTSMEIIIDGRLTVLLVEIDAKIGAKFVFTN